MQIPTSPSINRARRYFFPRNWYVHRSIGENAVLTRDNVLQKGAKGKTVVDFGCRDISIGGDIKIDFFSNTARKVSATAPFEARTNDACRAHR